jgi:hypothetical protein
VEQQKYSTGLEDENDDDDDEDDFNLTTTTTETPFFWLIAKLVEKMHICFGKENRKKNNKKSNWFVNVCLWEKGEETERETETQLEKERERNEWNFELIKRVSKSVFVYINIERQSVGGWEKRERKRERHPMKGVKIGKD